MRVAILADIHGNLPAVEAVLEDIARQTPDFICAAGDLALRGAHPKEVVELLFDRCHSVLMGNTDSYIAGNYLSGAYRERDHWKTDLLGWTRDQLGSTLVKKLGELPFSMRYSPRKGQDLYVCHANPRNLEESVDPTLDERQLMRFFGHLDAAAVAFGHLHFPYRRRVGRMLIADVASAGIPRDGDLRPAWGLFTFTPKGWRVQIRRVRYQVKKATQAIQARKVPGAPLLIHKLIEARYRHHAQLQEAARRHSGLPPMPPNLPQRPGALPPPPGHSLPPYARGSLGVRRPTGLQLPQNTLDAGSAPLVDAAHDLLSEQPTRDDGHGESGEHAALHPHRDLMGESGEHAPMHEQQELLREHAQLHGEPDPLGESGEHAPMHEQRELMADSGEYLALPAASQPSNTAGAAAHSTDDEADFEGGNDEFPPFADPMPEEPAARDEQSVPEGRFPPLRDLITRPAEPRGVTEPDRGSSATALPAVRASGDDS